jgi:ABC-type Fe3+-citrate transport system substrate-binding protein
MLETVLAHLKNNNKTFEKQLSCPRNIGKIIDKKQEGKSRTYEIKFFCKMF